jgi:hypothetical protein
MNLPGISRTILVFILVHGFSTHGLKAQTSFVPSKEDIAETAAWFDSLEWPDVTGKRFVEFTFGKYDYAGKVNDGPKAQGFLLGEDEKGFTIFCTGGAGDPMSITRVRKSDPSEPPEARIAHRVIAVADAVEALVARLGGRTEEVREWLTEGWKMSNHASVFVLARFCARLGHKDLAARLDAELQKLGNLSYLPDAPAGHSMFRNGIENEIGRSLTWRASEDFGDTSLSRPELLAHFERIQRDFPANQFHALVGDTVAMLRMMVAEDEAHRLTAKPIEKMSAEEQARELIFRLRDEYHNDLAPEDRPDHLTPMEQLIKLGFVAVPALIETIGDKRFTRSLNSSRNGTAFDRPRTIGECVHELLWRISGRSLDREGAISWWKDFQATGEKAMLIEGIRGGKRDSSNQAGRLMAMDPKACLEACVAGIQAAESDSVAERLISVIGYINLDKATAVLRREMQNHKNLHCRVAAAAGLLRHGGKDSVAWVVGEWRARAMSFKRDVSSGWGDAQTVISFLATCGDLSAMRALTERFPKLDAMEKFKMMEIVLRKVDFDPSADAGAKLPADVESCAEEMGITAFADKTAIDTMSIGSLFGPRVCDLAAIDLSQRWPERYSFDLKGTEPERDAQIVRMTNIWRGLHGLEPLPLPKLP